MKLDNYTQVSNKLRFYYINKFKCNMCGIIGVTGRDDAAELILEGLKRLEYRGYDSAGIATSSEKGINRCRAEGKIVNLEKALGEKGLVGHAGIGHTRWATHGAPVERNAHPHATSKVAVVHNGIIENYLEIRKELEDKSIEFLSDTDTEIIPQIITYYLDQGHSKEEAVKKSISRLEGAYAIGVIFADDKDIVYAARHGAPLVIGFGDDEKYIASDALALSSLTSELCYLEEGDIARLSPRQVKIWDKGGNSVEREITLSNLASISIGKENYRHFMQKEIFEQPAVLGDNIHAYYNAVNGDINLPNIPFDLADIERITIIACGTSYYAGIVASYWIQAIAGVPCEVDIASEFRYKNAIMPKNGVCVFISQSGETADTLAALKYAKSQGQKIFSIINVTESSIARESDVVMPIYSGPEIGVASTKAFTSQLMTLAFMCLEIAKSKNQSKIDIVEELAKGLVEAPALISEALKQDENIKKVSLELSNANDIMYIGRGVSYPIAMEGALKLKEISYIHSEATAAGELKHGPIALIDEKVPVVAIAPFDELFEKTASNIREVAARGGRIILVSDAQGIEKLKDVSEFSIEMPFIDCKRQENLCNLLNPLVYAVPIQLLAYHVAVAKGTDVDQPRNLAKSVTVE